MKVTKAQSQENRMRIVETASALFREKGYDGVSVADLMAAAGFTHGGFYKHFGSKADLMAEAATCGISQTIRQSGGIELTEFIDRYLAREHRDNRSDGCTMAALCSDAARQPHEIKSAFADGIETMLATSEAHGLIANTENKQLARAQTIDLFAHLIGAVVLSRACPDDSPLADEILDVCREQIYASLKPTDGA